METDRRPTVVEVLTRFKSEIDKWLDLERLPQVVVDRLAEEWPNAAIRLSLLAHVNSGQAATYTAGESAVNSLPELEERAAVQQLRTMSAVMSGPFEQLAGQVLPFRVDIPAGHHLDDASIIIDKMDGRFRETEGAGQTLQHFIQQLVDRRRPAGLARDLRESRHQSRAVDCIRGERLGREQQGLIGVVKRAAAMAAHR